MNEKQIIEFVSGITILKNLNNQIVDLLFLVKGKLQYCKKRDLPIIGNPLHKIFNEIIKLNYCSLQLIDNCKVYKELIEDDILIDHLFLLQLDGLLSEIRVMQNTYEMVYHRFTDCDNNDSLRKAN